jgi:CheY-like chemotaxis protein
VVDDDEFSQELMGATLMSLGVDNVQKASNGREALRVLQELAQTPDFLICDVFMPDMDGIEFLSHLAQKAYTGGIILVSGMNIEMMAIAQEVALSDGLKILGAYTKPLKPQVLAQVMDLSTS